MNTVLKLNFSLCRYRKARMIYSTLKWDYATLREPYDKKLRSENSVQIFLFFFWVLLSGRQNITDKHVDLR